MGKGQVAEPACPFSVNVRKERMFMANLTDQVRKGSTEAMESLFDVTKHRVMHLCTVLLEDKDGVYLTVPRIYRSLWDQVFSGKITTEEEFSEMAVTKTVTACKALVGKKNPKAFRIPPDRNFVWGVGEGKMVVRGEPWEIVLRNLPPLHRFLMVLPVLCDYSRSQLARLFHTNEETVTKALEAEAMDLKKIFAAVFKQTGREMSLSVEEFHRALEAKQSFAEIPLSVDTAVAQTIDALCAPIKEKIRQKRKRVGLVIVAVAALCLVGGTLVSIAVSNSAENVEAEVSTSLISEESELSQSSDVVEEETDSSEGEVENSETSEADSAVDETTDAA